MSNDFVSVSRQAVIVATQVMNRHVIIYMVYDIYGNGSWHAIDIESDEWVEARGMHETLGLLKEKIKRIIK